jgi:hypothetical protein
MDVPMKTPAPKPANFDALSRTWNNPALFARERAAYYASLTSTEVRDITVPIHERADA